MPTRKNLEASVSGSAARGEKPSDMSGNGALATENPNTTDTPTHLQADMTQAEALAIAWTGIEALAIMGRANIFRAKRTNRVIIELLAVELDPANGLRPA